MTGSWPGLGPTRAQRFLTRARIVSGWTLALFGTVGVLNAGVSAFTLDPPPGALAAGVWIVAAVGLGTARTAWPPAALLRVLARSALGLTGLLLVLRGLVSSEPGGPGVLVGVAILASSASLHAFAHKRFAAGQALATVPLLVGVGGMLLVATGTDGAGPGARHLPLAPTVGPALLALAIGLLGTWPDSAAVGALTADSTAARGGRRLLPAIVLIPIALALATLSAIDANLVLPRLGVTLYALAAVSALSVVGTLLVLEAHRAEGERASSRKALQASEGRYRALVDGLSAHAVVLLDPDGRIVTWSAGAERLTGFSAAEVVGRDLGFCFTPEDTDTDLGGRLLAEARRLGRVEAEGDRLRKDGERFTGHWTIAALAGDGADVEGFALIAADVTDARAAEERRRSHEEEAEANGRHAEANRLKSVFLHAISHELRGPVFTIMEVADLLHSGQAGPLEPLQRELLSDLLARGHHLQRLVNDVLDRAKVEAGMMDFRPAVIDLSEIAEEVTSAMQQQATAAGLVLTYTVEAVPGVVRMDPVRLRQVLYNYLSNAVKFTPAGGAVTLRIQPEGAEDLRIEVEDTGVGISPGDLPRLFIEFQQLEPHATHVGGGTGLGLALTRRIVEAQGGRVGVHSGDGGTVFFAVLPRRNRLPSGPVVVFPTERRGDPPRVLVVDDDPLTAGFVTEALRCLGVRSHTALTGEDALSDARDTAFSAAVLDLMLPDMTGIDVARSLRRSARNPDLAVILVTGASDVPVDAGPEIREVLHKPFPVEALRAALGRIGVPTRPRTDR